MNPVFVKIVEQGTVPTREDIAALLETVGRPGENRGEKQDLVRRLFEEIGHSGTNNQGFALAEDLEDYEAY